MDKESGSLTLAKEFRRALFRKKITIATAAAMMNIAEATMRTWLHRGHLTKGFAAKLADLLGWEETIEQLEQKYGITPSSWAQPRTMMDSDEVRMSLEQVLDFQILLSQKINDFSDENIAGFYRCFATMREGDLFVFSTLSVMPLEFDSSEQRWQDYGRAVADGISNGGTCLYLFPKAKFVSDITGRDKWYFGDMISEESFQKSADQFRSAVVLYSMAKNDWTQKQAEDWTKQRLVFHTYEDNPFAAPGFGMGMFQTKRSTGKIMRRMTLRIPTEFGGVLFIPETARDIFVSRFRKFVRETINSYFAQLSDPTRTPSQLKSDSICKRKTLEKIDELLTSDADAILWRKWPEADK